MSDTISLKKQTATDNPSTGSQTVSVASKMTVDFTLTLHSKQKESETVHGQYKEYFKYYPKVGAPTYIIKGQAYNRLLGDNGKQIEGGYAITHGIPKAFWDEWLDQHKEADYIVNGIIFASVDSASLRSESQEKSSVKSNTDRLDRAKLPKFGKIKIENAQID